MKLFEKKDWLNVIPFVALGLIFAFAPIVVFIETGGLIALYVGIGVGLLPIIAGVFWCLMGWYCQRHYEKTGELPPVGENAPWEGGIALGKR